MNQFSDSTQFFRTMVENASEAVILFDGDGRIGYANPTMACLLDIAAETLIGKNLFELARAVGYRKTHRARAFVRWARRRQQFDIDVRTSEDAPLSLACRITETAIGGKPAFIAAFRDIRERKAIETQLRASQARFAKVVDIAGDAIILIDATQRITLFNKGAEKIFGYAATEIEGRPLTLLMPERFRRAHGAHVEGFSGANSPSRLMGERREIIGCRKDGTEFPAEASISHFQQDRETVFTVILRDISERKAIEVGLAAAKAEADQAKQRLSAFLANMGHEFRTPLNAIIGFTDMMEHELFGPVGSERYRGYIQDIHGSGLHLLELVNEILDFSKTESNQLSLDESAFDIATVAENCVRMIAPKAEQSGLSVSSNLKHGIELKADQRRVKQIVLNLLANAIKYTPAGGRIVVNGGIDCNGGLVTSVTDTGIGIAEEDLPRVLEPFVQVNNAANRKTQGTGLGLPLSKRLAEMHGGRLQIRSSPGKGTTVAIHWPSERTLLAS